MVTRKASRKTSRQKSRTTDKNVLMVDSLQKIPALEKVLKSGKINIVLVFAEWCEACHRFRKNIWDPMCKRNAVHNRVAVRDDMVANTSLRNAKFDYLPSVLVVDEKGDVQTFPGPDGQPTNAMPTPKNLEDMERVVNVPVTPLKVVDQPQAPPPEYISLPESIPDMEIIKTTPTPTPSGIVYKPTPLITPPMETPPNQQKGGALLSKLKAFTNGLLPIKRRVTRRRRGRGSRSRKN